MCSLETARVHGENRGKRESIREGRVWSHEEQNSERDAEAFG